MIAFTLALTCIFLELSTQSMRQGPVTNPRHLPPLLKHRPKYTTAFCDPTANRWSCRGDRTKLRIFFLTLFSLLSLRSFLSLAQGSCKRAGWDTTAHAFVDGLEKLCYTQGSSIFLAFCTWGFVIRPAMVLSRNKVSAGFTAGEKESKLSVYDVLRMKYLVVLRVAV